MMARSRRSNERPDTVMQDRINQVDETSCTSRRDFRVGSFATDVVNATGSPTSAVDPKPDGVPNEMGLRPPFRIIEGMAAWAPKRGQTVARAQRGPIGKRPVGRCGIVPGADCDAFS